MEILDNICTQLGYQEFDNVKPLKEFSQKIGVKPSHIMMGLTVLVLLLVVLELGATLLSSVVGFLYPAYMSFKALESKNFDDDKHWLTYWTVYSFLTLFDSLLSIVLSFIPMYQFFKLAFFVWMFNPNTRGAEKIYLQAIQPLLKQYENIIDGYINQIEQKGKEAVQKVKGN